MFKVLVTLVLAVTTQALTTISALAQPSTDAQLNPIVAKQPHVLGHIEGNRDSQESAVRNGRKRRIVVGVAIGAALGGVIGYKFTEATCSACDFAVPYYVGAAVGAVIGGTAGGVIAATTTKPTQPNSPLHSTTNSRALLTVSIRW